MDFMRENIEKFLLDKSFPLAKKIKELYGTEGGFDKEGKYLTYEEACERCRQEATGMIEQIINGHLLSSEPDWKQATVMKSLAGLLYYPGYNRTKVHRGEIWLFQDLFVHTSVCLRLKR